MVSGLNKLLINTGSTRTR